MNYRQTEILDEKALTGTGTEIIPINVKDIISRISLSWRVVKVNNFMHSYAHKDITKIELVDGSDLLHSLDGGQNQALCIYDRKVGTMSHGQHMEAMSQFSMFGLDFGRKLYDKELAFDPTKFSNPALKVTYDVNVSDEGVETGYLEVWADCFDEKVITPIGFLMAKEHFNTGTPDSGYTYVALPTDYPYRKLLIQGYYKAHEPWNVISEARLNEDNGKRIPFDWDLEDYCRVRKGIDQPVIEDFDAAMTWQPLAYYLTPSTYWTTPIAMPDGDGSDLRVTEPGRGGYNIQQADIDGEAHGITRGWLPNHCYQFPFGDQDDIDDWYDVTRIGSLRLRLKVGVHHDDQRQAVVLQQLRRY